MSSRGKDLKMEAEYLMDLRDQSFAFDVLGSEEIILTIRALCESPEIESHLQVFISFLDEQRKICIPDSTYECSSQAGGWVLVPAGSGVPLESTFDMRVPSNAHVLEIRLVSTSKDNKCFVQPPQISHKKYMETESTDFVCKVETDLLASVPANRSFFVFYCNSEYSNSVFWNDRIIGLTEGLVELGGFVLFIGGMPARDTISPWLDSNTDHIMCAGSEKLTQIVSILSKRFGRNNAFVCCSSPDVGAFFAIERCNSCGWITAYDIQYDLQEIQRLGTLQAYHTYIESTIAQKVNYVIVSVPSLAQKLIFSGVSPHKCNVVPNAISKRVADRIKSSQASPDCSQPMNANYTIGFIGDLSALTLDWSKLINLARKYPNIQIELIGKGEPDIANLPDNIKIVFASNIDYLVKACAGWRAALVVCIKSRISESTLDSSIRLNEALGLKTIIPSTFMPLNAPNVVEYQPNENLLDLLNNLKNENENKSDTEASWFERAVQFKNAINHN